MNIKDLIPFNWRREEPVNEPESIPVQHGLSSTEWRPTPYDGFDQLFRRFFDDFPFGVASHSSLVPAINVRETEETFIIEAELPGMTADDIDVCIDGGYITVSGHRQEENDTGHKHRREFRYGSFRRVLPVPSGARATDAKAAYKNGVLTLSLEKEGAATPPRNRILVTEG